MEIERLVQLVGHCGPTTVAMMVSAYGVSIDQADLAREAGVSQTIEELGSRMDQINQGLNNLSPEHCILGKFGCQHSDICDVILGQRVPFGIEWQGDFCNEEKGTFSIGHYSILVEAARSSTQLKIIDPDDESLYLDGKFSMDILNSRWWEVNVMDDGLRYRSERFGFVVSDKGNRSALENLGFETVGYELLLNAGVHP